MSGLEVLTAATFVSAEALKLENEIGKLEPGKLADIVVLEGDPLQDLTTLRQPALVVKSGKISFKKPGWGGESGPQVYQPAPPTIEHAHPQDHFC